MSLRATVAATAIRWGYRPFRLVRARPRVTLLSRQSHSPSADLRAIAEAIRRADPTLEVVLRSRRLGSGWRNRLTFAVREIPAQMWSVARSRVVVVDTYQPIVSLPAHRPGLTRVQVWHALGAFKKFGWAATGTELAPPQSLARTMRLHAGYDWVLASGPACIPAYAEAFAVRPDQVVVAPLPRVDELTDPDRVAAVRARILRAYPELGRGPVAVFAPTMRRGAGTTPMDGSHGIDDGPDQDAEAFDVVGLRDALAEHGWTLVAKRHPLDARPWPAGIPAYDDVSTQELLTVADAFVTDYSSMVFEAALVGLPLYRYLPAGLPGLDPDDFFLPDRDIPGPVLTEVPRLVEAITSGADQAAQRQRFLAAYVARPAHGSCADQIGTLVAGWAAAGNGG